jgi:FMN phosphatase YigB (HAD superfamily)
MKLIFVDIDGTSSAPVYMVDGKPQIGMSDEAWDPFCREKGDDSYEYCEPVPALKAFLEEQKALGNRIFILTVVYNDHEPGAKQKFVDKNYPGIFEKVISVGSEDEKIGTMKEYAEKEGVQYEDCILIDDTYALLLRTLCAGFGAVHITNICSRFEKKLLEEKRQ